VLLAVKDNASCANFLTAADSLCTHTRSVFIAKRRKRESAVGGARPTNLLGALRDSVVNLFFGLWLRPRAVLGNPLIFVSLSGEGDRLAVIDMVGTIHLVLPNGRRGNTKGVINRGRQILRALRIGGRIGAV
jgi:hypothetical protein